MLFRSNDTATTEIYTVLHTLSLHDALPISVRTLRGFLKQIPPRLITRTARRIGARRAAQLRTFLDRLQAESFGGKAL